MRTLVTPTAATLELCARGNCQLKFKEDCDKCHLDNIAILRFYCAIFAREKFKIRAHGLLFLSSL